MHVPMPMTMSVPLLTVLRALAHCSKSYLIVISAGIAFNMPNGFLLTASLMSASTAAYLSHMLFSPHFWVGIVMWVVRFAGNMYHNEILLNIWHRAITKGKAKEPDNDIDDKQA